MMRRAGHLMTTLLLVCMMIFMGTGADVVRCLHSGRVSVCLPWNGDEADDTACPRTHDCMVVEHVEMSPTLADHAPDFDFDVMLPIICECHAQPTEATASQKDETHCHLCPSQGPPRGYLNRNCVWRI
ncbi:MAG: hypothetical protein IJ764_03635 [Bacteroidales bacterium]|nr:hypothetical protein [Bacteroidales bacterium]